MAEPRSAPVTKKCGACGLDKDLEDYARRSDGADGRRASCRVCIAKYFKSWKQKKSQAMAASGDDLESIEVDLGDLVTEADEDAAEDGLLVAMASYGTPIERASAEALLRCGSVAAAALSLQLTPEQLRAHLSELQRRAATRGFAPGYDCDKVAPPGFGVKGVSTLYDGDGNVRGQWVKTKKDEEDRIQRLLDAMSTIAERWQGFADPVPAPQECDEDLLVAYPLGDPHISMFAWAPETGNNHDLKIAEQTVYTAIDRLVELAPTARHALIANLGDFFHADNRGNTTTGGTPVDADGRWPKVLSVGVRLMRRIIDRALEKHEYVSVISEIGNHDWHTSIMLAHCLQQSYEREPRVHIDTSPAKFHFLRFGKVLLATTHGDTVKLASLAEIMACDRPEDWGETRHRYWLTGHVHHKQVQELRGCTVESFRTLAPADAWHRGQGYRSGQDMNALVFHRERGQIKRYTVGIDEIHDLIASAS